MKPPLNEPQHKICDYLSVPGPQETGAHLPQANLVSASKDVEETGFANFPSNLVGITHGSGPSAGGGPAGAGMAYETKKPG